MALVNRLLSVYWFMEKLIVPGLRTAQFDYELALAVLVGKGVRWLDVGCGWHVLPPWRERQERDIVAAAGQVVGVDLDLPSVVRHRSIRNRVLAPMGRLPFPDSTFDLVTANMVVEHLLDPEADFAEVSRVLRPGGSFLFLTPNARGYAPRLAGALGQGVKNLLIRTLESRGSDDVFPAVYRANTEDDVTRTAAAAGMSVEELRFCMAPAHFALVPPLAFAELLWLRRISRPEHADQRPCLMVRLVKPL